MTNCPPKLRGDLSKWLLQVNTGVYVGHVNPKVRDALWKRICENIHDGQATMVFTAMNEQHFDFYVHNTSWEPIDLDGIKLIKHLEKTVTENEEELKSGYSIASKRLMSKRSRNRKTSGNNTDIYIVLDIETTGLSAESDSIIEIGAIEYRNGKENNVIDCVLKYDGIIPEVVKELTGIDETLLNDKGMEPQYVLEELFRMLSHKKVLAYNASFDIAFLNNSSIKYELIFPNIEIVDVLEMAKAKLKGLENYRLETVARNLGIEEKQTHRAVNDCRILNSVYGKLNLK